MAIISLGISFRWIQGSIFKLPYSYRIKSRILQRSGSENIWIIITVQIPVS